MDVLIILLLIVGALVFVFVQMWNSLQAFSQKVKQAMGNIAASMRKRVDLANKLIDIARSYGEHEKLTMITASNNMAGLRDVQTAGVQVEAALMQVRALEMRYPDLKANQTYQQLMGQLTTIEDDLQRKREGYNAAVNHYNTYRASLPQALIASQVGFLEAPYYQVDEAGLEPVKDFVTADGAHLAQALQRGAGAAIGAATGAGRAIAQGASHALEQARPHFEAATDAARRQLSALGGPPSAAPLAQAETDAVAPATATAPVAATPLVPEAPAQNGHDPHRPAE